MSAAQETCSPEGGARHAFAPHELASMQSVVEAVCVELGVTAREKARRKAVADRVTAAFRHGQRLPLDMVSAGLKESSHHA